MSVTDAGDGPPVLYFHGGGDSPASRPAETYDARVISVERCTHVPGRTLQTWARDVLALADELGLDRFGVIGWSAGGPHALAVAAAAPDRVDRVALAASMPPHDLAALTSQSIYLTTRVARRSQWLATRMLERWGRQPTPELTQPEHTEAYARGRVESFADGGRWLAQELAYLARPWGFDLADVRVPVTLWWGTRDNATPLAIADAYAKRLPDATLKVVDANHQILFSHWREILADATPQTRP